MDGRGGLQEEHEEFERVERAKIEANMAKMLAEMEAQRSRRSYLREHLLRMIVCCQHASSARRHTFPRFAIVFSSS